MTFLSEEPPDDDYWARADEPDPRDILKELTRFAVGQGEPWMARAACRGYGPTPEEPNRPNPFFPERGQSTQLAYEMCASCPVAEMCGQYQRRTGSVGIWGGTYTEHPVSPATPMQDARPRRIVPITSTHRRGASQSAPRTRIAARKKMS